MTLVLGMMFRDADLPWLQLHMPIYRSAFEHIIAASDEVDGEAASWLNDEASVDVRRFEFHEHWSDFLNQMIQYATRQGFTKYVRLDPDELIFPSSVQIICDYLDKYAVLQFPRVNFFYNRTQYNIHAYPDVQVRAWRLDGRPRYVGQRHEGLTWGDYQPEEVFTFGQDVQIYHYGDASRTAMEARALKYYNASQRDKGLPMIEALPPDAAPGARPYPQPGAETAPYTDPQPLDPDVCGLAAPFEE